jgi:hypothetical protein
MSGVVYLNCQLVASVILNTELMQVVFLPKSDTG